MTDMRMELRRTDVSHPQRAELVLELGALERLAHLEKGGTQLKTEQKRIECLTLDIHTLM